MEGFFDTEYFIEGYKNLKPHWRGLGKSHIYYIPKTKSWRLESFYATEKVIYAECWISHFYFETLQYAELAADDTDPNAYYPLGRLEWLVYDGICQMDGGTIKYLYFTFLVKMEMNTGRFLKNCFLVPFSREQFFMKRPVAKNTTLTFYTLRET